MKAVPARSWEEFETKILELRSELPPESSPLLFRGHADANWLLETTLERAGHDSMAIGSYHNLIQRIRPAIETFTGARWDMPDDREMQEMFQNATAFDYFPPVDLYRYMAYLRHHGFPSPLMDWSRSPYVAALFAFKGPRISTDSVAIFVFCETPDGARNVSFDGPMMRSIGPYIRSHPRHFRQQSDYTICGRFNRRWFYAPHEHVFARGDEDQNMLWKFTLPSSERLKVLKALDEYNLTPFSLFDSEESLMETMWLRELVFRRE